MADRAQVMEYGRQNAGSVKQAYRHSVTKLYGEQRSRLRSYKDIKAKKGAGSDTISGQAVTPQSEK